MRKTLASLITSTFLALSSQSCSTIKTFDTSSTLGDVMAQTVIELQSEYKAIDENNLTQKQQTYLEDFNTQFSQLSEEQKQTYLEKTIGPDSYLNNFLQSGQPEFGNKEKVFLMQQDNTPYQFLKHSKDYNPISLEDTTKEE